MINHAINVMKSQKGLTLIQLVLIIIVLMLLAGVSTYVALIGNDSPKQATANNVNVVVEEDV